MIQSSNKGNRTLHLPWPQPQAHPSSPSNQSSSSQPWGNLPARVRSATLPPFTLGIQVPAEVPGRGSTDEETIVEQSCPLGKCHGSSTRTIKNAVMVFTRSFFPVYFKPCFLDITAWGQGAPPLLTEGLACRGCTRCSLYDGWERVQLDLELTTVALWQLRGCGCDPASPLRPALHVPAPSCCLHLGQQCSVCDVNISA